jgi:signal transduction histidine kinase
MSGTQTIDLLLAALNLTVAVYVVVRSRSWLGRPSLPVLALGTYFLLRSVSRLIDVLDPVATRRNLALDVGLDLMLATSLVVVLFTIEAVLRGLAAREDAARYRAAEYARARRHYTQVVRHRMMNPIQAIKGGAQTLQRTGHPVDPGVRDQLLQVIVDAASELETVSLVPERRDELERDLDAVPDVPGHPERRRTTYPDSGSSTGPR